VQSPQPPVGLLYLFFIMRGVGSTYIQVGGSVGFFFWVLGERGRGANAGGQNLLLHLSSARPREEEDLWYCSKRHRLLLSSFFFLSFFSSEMHETSSFLPKRAISFKPKLAPKHVRFQISPSICVLFFYFDPWC